MSALHDGIDVDRFEIRQVERFDIKCKACGAMPDSYVGYYRAKCFADAHLRECKGSPK